MNLREHFQTSGNWLFRHRGVLPILLVPLFVLALAGARSAPAWWQGPCLTIALLGFGLRVVTVGFAAPGTSGRNRGAQRATSLNTTGIYSLVRHPLYLANYLMWLGVALVPRVWWLPVIVTLAFWLYYERIMFAEEEYLQREFGPAFSSWAAETPAFLPHRLRWRSSDRPFSLRTVLRREYSGLWALVTLFAALDAARDYALTGRVALDRTWAAVCVVTTLAAVVLRTLRHRTRLLEG